MVKSSQLSSVPGHCGHNYKGICRNWSRLSAIVIYIWFGIVRKTTVLCNTDMNAVNIRLGRMSSVWSRLQHCQRRWRAEMMSIQSSISYIWPASLNDFLSTPQTHQLHTSFTVSIFTTRLPMKLRLAQQHTEVNVNNTHTHTRMTTVRTAVSWRRQNLQKRFHRRTHSASGNDNVMQRYTYLQRSDKPNIVLRTFLKKVGAWGLLPYRHAYDDDTRTICDHSIVWRQSQYHHRIVAANSSVLKIPDSEECSILYTAAWNKWNGDECGCRI